MHTPARDGTARDAAERDESPAAPWFNWHPGLAVAVVGVLYAAVFVVRLEVHGSQDTISALYVLPIALLAVTFGLRAGLLGGLVGVGLLGIWVRLDHIALTPLGWLSRAIPILLLGLLLGSATDRLRAAAAAERALALATLREREAAEINDSILQGLTAAKWSFEAGQNERGLQVLTETMETGQALVGNLLRGRALQKGMPGRRASGIFNGHG